LKPQSQDALLEVMEKIDVPVASILEVEEVKQPTT
jgi:hypothetical protein